MAAIKRDGEDLMVGEATLSEGVNVSKVSDTNYIDYDGLEVNDSYLDYAKQFLDKKSTREVRLLKR